MSAAVARIGDVPTPIRDLFDPATCPVELLPWLAWAMSVDEWDPLASEAEKRGIISASLFVHKHKGTLASLRRAIAPLGYSVNIVEWYNDTPPAPPYTFRLEILVQDRGVDDTIYGRILRLVNTYKNVRSHMVSLNVKAVVPGTMYLAGALMSGVMTEVFPYMAGDIESTSVLFFAAAEQSFDTVSVYPAI